MKLNPEIISLFHYFLILIGYLKKLMYQRVKNFLDKNDILFIINKSQYGFREKHTTQRAAIDIVNIIQNNTDLKLFAFGIFLDLKKAFDTVHYSLLLKRTQSLWYQGHH